MGADGCTGGWGEVGLVVGWWCWVGWLEMGRMGGLRWVVVGLGTLGCVYGIDGLGWLVWG